MVTRRTLLIFNFGAAVLFVVMGMLSLMVYEEFLARPNIVPPFDQASAAAIRDEQDIEKLRQRATFYFGLGRDLKRARYSDTDTLVRDFRFLCFLLGAIFSVGGAMSLVALKVAAPQS